MDDHKRCVVAHTRWGTAVEVSDGNMVARVTRDVQLGDGHRRQAVNDLGGERARSMEQARAAEAEKDAAASAAAWQII
jgi:hypothetical protein